MSINIFDTSNRLSARRLYERTRLSTFPGLTFPSSIKGTDSSHKASETFAAGSNSSSNDRVDTQSSGSFWGNLYSYCLFFIFMAIFTSCKKMVEIPGPINSITTSEAYGNDATAISTVLGIYNHMNWNKNGIGFANGGITVNLGMAADELNRYGGNSTFQNNTCISSDGAIANLWNGPYFSIYMANTVIEALQRSTGVSGTLKNQLTGEAKFIRAFAHFYLVNLFGDVPLVTTSSYKLNSLLSRSQATVVYQQIIQDLTEAQQLLSDKYARPDGGFYSLDSTRTRPNKAAATALLARAYLYSNDWANAEMQASVIINNSVVYSLATDLSKVFLASNTQYTNNEAIWQLQTAVAGTYSTREGNTFLPSNNISTPNYFLPPQLMNAFEVGDLRKTNWVGITVPMISGVPTTYYYPRKFRVRQASAGNITEYNFPLRLAEQYLIRAEATAHLNKLSEAIADLNEIRKRANLAALPGTLNQAQVLTAVAQERRIELFAEWAHRWFDLKRTGQADNVLGALKPNTWQSYAELLPLPLLELQSDPTLVQNPGYQ